MAYTNAIFYIDLVSGSDTTRSTLSNATVSPYYDTEGSELAPALTTGNWTFNTPPWRYLTTPDRLERYVTGAGPATPTAATQIEANCWYKIVITVDSISGANLTITIGGTDTTQISTSGTYTYFLKTSNTNNISLGYSISTMLCVISALSVKKLTYNSTNSLPVKLTYTSHGQTTGSVVYTSSFTSYLNGDWKVTKIDNNNFTLDTSVWVDTADTTGNVVPFGGGSWADAWKTIISGATALRIQGGDTIRISKTPDPVSIGNGKWEDCPSGGFNPTTVNIASSTNASPIEITTSANHNLVTGDVALIHTHSTNYTANGNWQITYVSATKFTLDNSVGVGAGTGGTIRKVNSKCVILSTAQNLNVVTTEGGWTATGDTTINHQNLSTFDKFSYFHLLLTLDATPQTSTLQAYKAITSTNFSSYQKLCFWIMNSSAISANQWYIALCSDTAGATPVDVFKIPAIPSINRGIPLTITKDGGGNLGSAIQSVAIYTDTSAPTASTNIRIDNIITSTTSGLALDSLISKNSAAQGGTEGFYGIQSINGKIVALDNETNTISTAGKGYSGASETVTTYIRETFKTSMASTSSSSINTINDGGTSGNLIAYEFGYEVGTTNQNGETFLDGLNGHGYGIDFSSSYGYESLNWCSLFRYNRAISAYSNNISILNISNLNNNNYGLYSSGNNCSFRNIYNCNNNNYYGINFANNISNLITNIVSNNSNSAGLLLDTSNNNKINSITCKNNPVAVYYYSANNNIITDLISINNGTTVIYQNVAINYMRNALFSESTEFTGEIFAQGVLWSYDHDQTDGNHWGYFYGGTFNWQTTTKHLTEAGSWKTVITSSDRKSDYKAVLPVAEVAGVVSTNLTVTAWVKKDHATNIACRLVCYADNALGTTEQADTKADDTDWEQLSITLNSAHANPVFWVVLETWYVTGTSNSYVGTISAV